MQNIVRTIVASASELQSSDLYMTVKTPMFTVPAANLNGVRCTAEFLDEIVANQDKYIGLPLCADVDNLAKGRYTKLGHCYDAVTGTFSSSMIGSFYKFEKEEREDGAALIGYARIMKRNKKVCKAVAQLFAAGMLKFSFEISCGSYEELEDGTLLIDAAGNNYLEGMCIVSFPACPDAVAQELVAEIVNIGKEADEMCDVIESAEVVAEETVAETTVPPEAEAIVAEEETEPTATEPEEIRAEESDPEKDDEEQPEETEDDEEEHKETAQVYTTVTHVEHDSVRTYDNETGVEHEMQVTTEERVFIPEAETAEAVAKTAEEAVQAEAEEAHEEVVAEEAPAEPDPVAALREEIAELKKLIAEMREQHVVAEEELETPVSANGDEVNPFIAEISTPVKYSLLESIEKNPRSLLERA